LGECASQYRETGRQLAECVPHDKLLSCLRNLRRLKILQPTERNCNTDSPLDPSVRKVGTVTKRGAKASSKSAGLVLLLKN